MESIVGSAALDAIAQQDAAEKQALDTKATSALNTANEVASQFITVKAAAEAATATATNAYTAAQTANAAASNAQTQTLANRQAIISEANARGQADTAIQAQIDNIVNGTTVVGKASNDANGNDIPTTYATKAELAPVATSGDYDDLTNKPTAGTNIEISTGNVISAPNVATKVEAVGSFTLSIDPQTYELSIQAKNVNGTNIGTAQTVDLPIETMVVSGSYDDATQSITLTLQNGQTITFSVAGLVAGLQTQLTFDSTPTNESTNPVTSGGVHTALAGKQNTLTFDAAPTQNSSNPVTSGGVHTALAGKQNTLTFDNAPTQNSSNPVTSGGVYDALAVVASSAAKMTEILWADLKALRDSGTLIKGMQYRITDYVTTTVQYEAQSAGHAFDIIVTADSGSVLNENARAAIHAGDTYFSDSKLQAWKLKYCIDNDTSRFAWADATNGKGVIYQMIDEFDNDLPYDFKNVQFKRYKLIAKSEQTKPDALVNGYYGTRSSQNPAALGSLYPQGYSYSTADHVFRYTFDYNGADFSLNKYASKSGSEWAKNCYSNKIAPYYYNQKQGLNNVVFNNTNINSNNKCNILAGSNIYSSTFGDSCYHNTFGNSCYLNIFGNKCYANMLGDSCYHNTFGNNCSSNTFGIDCSSGTFGSYYLSNMLGNNCSSNTFGDSCTHNTLGTSCSSNTFGTSCSSNTFGTSCSSNTFGSNCSGYTFAIPNEIRYFTMSRTLFYFDDEDSSSLKLQLINNSSSSVTVTGLYYVGEFEERETIGPIRANVTVPARTTANIIVYDDSDYVDGYCYWSLSATINGRTINNTGEYD